MTRRLADPSVDGAIADSHMELITGGRLLHPGNDGAIGFSRNGLAAIEGALRGEASEVTGELCDFCGGALYAQMG